MEICRALRLRTTWMHLGLGLGSFGAGQIQEFAFTKHEILAILEFSESNYGDYCPESAIFLAALSRN